MMRLTHRCAPALRCRRVNPLTHRCEPALRGPQRCLWCSCRFRNRAFVCCCHMKLVNDMRYSLWHLLTSRGGS